MERTTQVIFISLVVLAQSDHTSFARELADHEPDHSSPPDIFDPLRLMPHGAEMFDPLGLFHGQHHNIELPGMQAMLSIQDGRKPLVKEVNVVEKKQKDNIKTTTESSPLKITLLPKVDNSNNTVEIKDIDEQLGKEEKPKDTPKGINSTSITELLGNEPVLRTNVNKTVAAEPNHKKILKPKVITSTLEKQKPQHILKDKDSIVFPDDVEDAKSGQKGTSEGLNKTANINDGEKLNITKNSDGSNKIVFPLQVLSQVPTQATDTISISPVQSNGNTLTGSSNTPEVSNYVYQAMPVTNDVFPNRPAIYTTANAGQGPLYTNVVNTFPQNGGQLFLTDNNNFNQNPSSVVPSNQYYSLPIQNGNNFYAIPSNNIGIAQNPQNNLASILLVNPNSLGNSQPIYNGQQQPTNNVQSNNVLHQGQTVAQGVTPYLYNQGNIATQSINNPVSNNNGIGQQNFGQTYVANANTQPYLISNGNQLNNYVNNVGQPISLRPLGNTLTTGNALPDNTQKYMLVNVNQQNVPQNGQGNSISLQNGQLVALVPRQQPNNMIINNVQSTQQVNGNIPTVQQMIQSPTNDNTIQPNIILMNTTPNNAVFPNPNGQNSFNNGQNLLSNGQTIYKLVPVPNGNVGNGNQVLNAVNLIALKDKEDHLHATENNNR